MAHTLTKINIHLIFHVRSTGITLLSDDLPRIWRYIGGIIHATNGIPIEIGGMPDHIHILTSLPPAMSLADFVRAIKAGSSKWIKKLSPLYGDFAWQEGYGAFSISPSLLDKTVNYIRTQAVHHARRSFREEYKMFLDAYGIEYDEKYMV